MSKTEFADTHCHLNLPPLRNQLADVLARAREAGVTTLVVPGVTPDGWPEIAALAVENMSVLPAYGLHPQYAHLYHVGLIDNLMTYLPHAVAVGEIGLDYMLPEPTRKQQREIFRSQVKLAVSSGLPVLVHCRKAFQELLTILREERVDRVGGVMHAFSGSPEFAVDCIRLGLFIGVAGPVTYLNAVRPVEVVRRIPLEHLVLETDAPDMAPEPHCGQVNEPAYMLETARRVAAIKGTALETVAAVTSWNAERLFSRYNRS